MYYLKKYFGSNLFLFLLYRISSVIFIQTSYVPDEYWQSLEVAHNMAFGYGYLTWEWKHGLRSYIHPFMFAVLYKLLKCLKLDTPATVTVIPRLAQAILTALSDNYFFYLCKNLGCKSFWTKVFIFTNWFWYFCGSRTVLNMFETSITIIALYYYPWNIIKQKFLQNDHNSSVQWTFVRNKSLKYLSLVALNCVIRPTAVTIWGPLVVYQLVKLYPNKVPHFVLVIAAPIGAAILFVSVLIDYYWYQKLTFPPYNFLKSNIFSGIASFYGAHPMHWYLTQGIPAVLALHIVPFLAGSYIILRSYRKPFQDKFEKICTILLIIIVINIFIFSTIPHKEFRFILPLLPMMEIIAIKCISNSSKFNSRKKCGSLLATALIIGFIVPAALFGIFHQKGTLRVMSYLSREAHQRPDNTSLLFLTPCHSTPLYSHLHVNVTVRFLTCEPPLSKNHFDESNEFFRRPVLWLENNWNKLKNPSHVVMFDTIKSSVDDFLRDKGLILKRTFVHTIFKGSSAGDNVLVYER